MNPANQLPAAITVTEFLARTPPGGDRWELVDGTPRAMAPSAPRQGAIQAEVARLIGNHLAESHPKCRVVTEPGIQPKVRGDLNTRVPDLAVTCATWDPENRLLREPLVVIEILSPLDKADTWANVWTYPTIPSMREILVVYTAEVRLDLLRRETDGTWPDNPAPLRLGDIVTVERINFSAPVVAFYRTASAGVEALPMLTAYRLWKKLSANGKRYLVGRMGGRRVMVMANTRPTDEDDASHVPVSAEAPPWSGPPGQGAAAEPVHPAHR
jgi:Uma2 family endonuclease